MIPWVQEITEKYHLKTADIYLMANEFMSKAEMFISALEQTSTDILSQHDKLLFSAHSLKGESGNLLLTDIYSLLVVIERKMKMNSSTIFNDLKEIKKTILSFKVPIETDEKVLQRD